MARAEHVRIPVWLIGHVAADWEWSQICALAAALLECETLSGRAARAVLKRRDRG